MMVIISSCSSTCSGTSSNSSRVTLSVLGFHSHSKGYIICCKNRFSCSTANENPAWSDENDLVSDRESLPLDGGRSQYFFPFSSPSSFSSFLLFSFFLPTLEGRFFWLLAVLRDDCNKIVQGMALTGRLYLQRKFLIHVFLI